MRIADHLLFLIICLMVSASPAVRAEAGPPRRPGTFAVIYNVGYAGDGLPQSDDDFEKLALLIKKAGYNTILCQYTDARSAICRKHGLKVMVDLLVPEHHIYKNAKGAEALCKSLVESDVVFAYHLWSDRIGGTVAGRNRDVANVRSWDTKHAAYVGSYNGRELDGLTHADMIGYYDFHWKRGGHWRHLFRTRDAAKKIDARFLKYVDGAPGKVGEGNYNRVLYTLSHSVAFGLKGYMYHHTGQELDTGKWQWKTLGEDLARVNARIAPLGPALMEVGNASAVYSTVISKSAKNRDVEQPGVPAEFKAVPEDYWFAITAGEAVVGQFDDAASRDVLVFANHNAYQAQGMKVQMKVKVKAVERFDREAGKWTALDAADGFSSFELGPADAELIRVSR